MKRISIFISIAMTLLLITLFNCNFVYASNLENGFATSAKACVVMERDSQRILYEKSPNLQLPMASTTKIVTALTVINHANLDETVVVPKQACGIEGSSIYLREGEKITIRELLYGLMLRSGNDSAVCLALHVGKSIQNFAEMMNETAKQCGCKNSNFVNPHGLHDDNHYTTAYDLAKITCRALQNEEFSKIVSTKTTKIANDGYEYPRVITNKNKLLTSFDGADGVKTGYTKRAGRCFVGSATRNGMQVVVVVLNCGPMFEETAVMLAKSFANFTNTCIVPKNKLCGVVYKNGKPTYYVCNQSFSYPLKDGESFVRKITIDDNHQIIEVFVDDLLIKTIKLDSLPCYYGTSIDVLGANS